MTVEGDCPVNQGAPGIPEKKNDSRSGSSRIGAVEPTARGVSAARPRPDRSLFTSAG